MPRAGAADAADGPTGVREVWRAVSAGAAAEEGTTVSGKVLTMDVPIIGQAVVINGWSPTVVFTCQCDAKATLILPSTNAMVQCPGCKKAFMIGKIVHEPQHQRTQIEIAHAVLPPAAGSN